MFANITLLCTATLSFPWESVFCYLRLPFLNPGKWAKTFVAFTEIFTWFIRISLQFAAPVIVNIALPAAPSLVLIWESWIKWSSRQSIFGSSFLSAMTARDGIASQTTNNTFAHSG
jgi:hypothetical protein